MATQGLGGIPETGIGVGLAQVLPKQQYDVPDLAGAFSKGLDLAQKRKEAEAKLKTEKKKEDKGVQGWTGETVTGAVVGQPMIEAIRKKIKEGEMPSPDELNDLTAFIEVSKDFRERKQARKTAATTWLKGGQSLSPAGEEAQNNIDDHKWMKKTAEESTNPETGRLDMQIFQDKLDRELDKMQPEEKKFDYLKATQSITFQPESNVKESEKGDYFVTESNQWMNKSRIKDYFTGLVDNPDSAIGHAAMTRWLSEVPDPVVAREKAIEELTNIKVLQYGKKTGETISEKSKGGGSGDLTEKDIVENQKYTATIPGEGTKEQQSPASLVLPSNEVLNIPISTDIIDRSTGTGIADVTGQLNISGGVINIVKVKRAGKEIYEPQLFATGTDVSGNKYDVQIPLAKIRNTIKRHDKALGVLENKADEINKRKDNPEGKPTESKRKKFNPATGKIE